MPADVARLVLSDKEKGEFNNLTCVQRAGFGSRVLVHPGRSRPPAAPPPPAAAARRHQTRACPCLDRYDAIMELSDLKKLKKMDTYFRRAIERGPPRPRRAAPPRRRPPRCLEGTIRGLGNGGNGLFAAQRRRRRRAERAAARRRAPRADGCRPAVRGGPSDQGTEPASASSRAGGSPAPMPAERVDS
jgi:hypothetical protein